MQKQNSTLNVKYFRIVNVSSVAHKNAKMNWNDLHYQNYPGTYKPFLSYGQSKLANILHAKELSRRVQKDGISVFSLHPGKYKYIIKLFEILIEEVFSFKDQRF